jgi:hypothetical protein
MRKDGLEDTTATIYGTRGVVYDSRDQPGQRGSTSWLQEVLRSVIRLRDNGRDLRTFCPNRSVARIKALAKHRSQLRVNTQDRLHVQPYCIIASRALNQEASHFIGLRLKVAASEQTHVRRLFPLGQFDSRPPSIFPSNCP